MTKPKTSIKSVRLPDDMWDKIAAKAEVRGVKVNAAMAEAAALWLTRPVVKMLEPSLEPTKPESEAARAFRVRKEAQNAAARLAVATPRSKR